MFQVSLKASWRLHYACFYLVWSVVAANAACSQPLQSLYLDATSRYSGYSEGKPQCFETFLPTSGIWMLEISAASSTQAEPKIDLRHHRSVTYLDRMAQSLLVGVTEPGNHHYCVTAQDPREVLGNYRIISFFWDRLTIKEGDPKEEEVIPDPKSQIPDGIRSGSLVAELCAALREDDHGDTLRCATDVFLGSALSASLESREGDDEDLFTFTIEELRTIEIETEGEVETFMILYNDAGYLLKSDRTASRRLVKTLSPGRYFLRVGSLHAEQGHYRLRFDRLIR